MLSRVLSVLELTGSVCFWRPLVANVLKRHLCDLSFEGRKEGSCSHLPNAGSLILSLINLLLSPPCSDRPRASYSAVHKLVLHLFDFSKTYQRHWDLKEDRNCRMSNCPGPQWGWRGFAAVSLQCPSPLSCDVLQETIDLNQSPVPGQTHPNH